MTDEETATHELTYEPIKLNVVDLKTNQCKKTYVIVGDVPDNVKKELLKLEKLYNNSQRIPALSALKKFYGVKWQTILGVAKTGGSVHSNSLVNEIISGFDLNDAISGGNDDEISGGNDDEISGGNDNPVDKTSGADKLVFDISGLDLLNPDDYEIVESPKPVVKSNGVNIIQNDNKEVSQEVSQDANQEVKSNVSSPREKTVNRKVNLTENIVVPDRVVITEEDLDVGNHTVEETIFVEKNKQLTLDKIGSIKFIFDTPVYPADNILEFKYKISLLTGIPIYRQHLWLKYKGASIPCNYMIHIYKNNVNIDIESLTSYYQKTDKKQKYDEILDIPIDINNYRNKDYLVVKANDTFNLIYTNYEKYDTVEYYLVDLEDLIDPNDIYNKLSKDRYQLEMIYYGFIIKYFPMLTYDVFLTYIKNESSVSITYPELKPDKSNLQRKFALESKITNESYAGLSNVHIHNVLYSSIIGTVININNFQQSTELLLNLRNIFDLIELTPLITYCKANILHDNRNIVMHKSYMNEKEPNDILYVNTLLIKIKTQADTNENIRIIFFKNGNYTIHTEWREENHMSFEKIIKTVSKMVNPIIDFINKASSKVKFYDLSVPHITDKNTNFINTNIVFHIDDDVTETRYNIFKQVIADFVKANIIIPKETSFVVLEYFFIKGMYYADSANIEKSFTLSNYYEFLSNGPVKQKWDTSFVRTHSMEINNVSGKIRISIGGIKNDTEMRFFHLYLIGMINIYLKNAAHIKRAYGDQQAKHIKALKNLKIQDPLLYDFKKIYKSNIVYSKICQKPYQPQILNDDEYKNLSSERKKHAVKYWNFTRQTPVWYSCPNPKYPFIKFIIKQHPKDFCIPCCKKLSIEENINPTKLEIHNTCLKIHSFTGEKTNVTKSSRYIATYGKDIEIGRISRLPENTLEPLFFNTYSTEQGIDQECITADGYYLFGIEQNLPTVSNVGMIYCLMHALNMQLDAFLAECSKRIKAKPDNFRVLLNGSVGMYFANYNELCNVIGMLNKKTLIEQTDIDWNQLFISICYYYFGINSILFDDQQKEHIDLRLPIGLKNVNEMFPASHQHLIVLRKKIKYYPVYLLNTELFKRTGIIDTRLFNNHSGLISIIRAIVKQYFDDANVEKFKADIDLAILKEFADYMEWPITKYFVNYNNLCYAVEIHDCYIPCEPSYYSLGKIELVFDLYSRKIHPNKLDHLMKLVSAYNKFVAKKTTDEKLHLSIYPRIDIKYWIKSSNDIVGFISHDIFYPCSATEKQAKHYLDIPVKDQLYSVESMNSLIYNLKAGKDNVQIGLKKSLNNNLQTALYDYYLYSLVLLQFINIFNRQQNKPLRRKIMICLAKTNFDKNTDNIKQIIEELEPDDQSKIKNIISRYIANHRDKKQLLHDIGETRFNFDNVFIDKLKNMPHVDVIKELKKISKTFITIGNLPKNFKFPNMLITCDNKVDKDSYCYGNKFIVAKDKYDTIIDILASDLINPLKRKWILNIAFIEKTIHYFKFIRRPAESITLELL